MNDFPNVVKQFLDDITPGEAKAYIKNSIEKDIFDMKKHFNIKIDVEVTSDHESIIVKFLFKE